MRPPVCAVCRDRFSPSEGGLVRFADHEPLDHPGHPTGLEWFCGRHLAAAEALADRPTAEALRRLRAPWRRLF
ncbi:MAG: hypothetical protein R3181_08415 [Rubricoccaceae bacterium]|nr:hypothetical protein [Rubricoccaceae bacterium]